MADTGMKVDRAPVSCAPAWTLPSLLLLLVKARSVYFKNELPCSVKPLMMMPIECQSKLVDAEGDVDGDDGSYEDGEEDRDFSGEEGDHDSKGSENGNAKNHLKEDGDDEEADDPVNGQDDDDNNDNDDDDDENGEDEVEEEPDDDDDEEEEVEDEEEDEEEEVQPPKKRKK